MFKVPAVILSGFLGSGKTTLLMRLLAEASEKGLRPGILMNELGKRDVDGAGVRDGFPQLPVVQLFDGCICCDRKEDVAESLLRLLAASPDVLLIELTGVADPEEVADALTHPLLKDRVRLQAVVTVLDAEHVLDYNSIFATDRNLVRTLRKQIGLADLILINKTDRVPEAQLRRIGQAVRKSNDRSVIYRTVRCQAPLDRLTAEWRARESPGAAPAQARFSIMRREVDVHTTGGMGEQSYSRLTTLELVPRRPMERRKLEAFLAHWKSSLLRAKGYVPVTGREGNQLFQYAGGRASWEPSGYPGDPYLVLIGLDLDSRAVKARWEELS